MVSNHQGDRERRKDKPKAHCNCLRQKSWKGQEEPGIEVELFRAIADKQLDVEYVAKDATQANLIFRNQSSEPLNIKLPETFETVPVLEQRMGGMGGMGGGGMGGMGGMGGGGMGGMGGGQGMGGGMNGGGGGMDMGGMGGMGAVWNVSSGSRQTTQDDGCNRLPGARQARS